MYERGLEKTERYISLARSHSLTDVNELVWLRTAIDENLPIGLHHSMFIPTLEGQLTEEQQQHWLPLARHYGIIGTYAQTEIAHGSFVRGLQTTATFDPDSDSFTVHTPSPSAIKWWPGNLGKTANVVVLMARLISLGRDYGVHPFLVPIRDLDSHRPLPGVTVGDLGPKFAYEMNDNGYLRLEHVRIPRANMMMRFATLDSSGHYAPAAHAKLSYGTMVFVRSWIVIEASRYLAKALTIAVRYSAVRLQFPKAGQAATAEEEQVLNYQTQQHQLFPLLATAFAFHFTGAYMKRLYYTNMQQLSAGDLSLVKAIHVNSSGLKALTTAVTADAIELCRKCCGGHGYSRFSGLIDLYGNYVPACTYEGDNTIMLLQTARELLHVWNEARGLQHDEKKSAKAAKSTPKSKAKNTDPHSLAALYATDDWRAQKSTLDSVDNCRSLDLLLAAFHHRSSRVLSDTCQRFNELIAKHGLSPDVAYEQCKVELVRCAKSHCWMLILDQFIQAVRRVRSEPPVLAVLTSLCQLFGVSVMERDMGDFTEDGYVSSAQAAVVRQTVRELLAVVRVDAVALVDSFDFSDHYLNSALGKWDGDVYNCLYAWSNQANPMNQSDIAPGVERILLPLMKAGRDQLGGGLGPSKL